MFKKTTLLTSILFVSACSSNMVSTDYENDVVVQKNQHEGYVETVGKDIVPVDLLELNLGLKMSVLSVTAKVESTSEDQKTQPITSDVFFQIEYMQDKPKSDGTEQQKKEFDRYSVAVVDGVNINLVATDASQSCDEKQCLVAQSFNFPVETAQLESAVIDGLKFSLYETTKNEKLVLETMIPARYINALLAK